MKYKIGSAHVHPQRLVCVSTLHVDELMNQSYSVKRSSGAWESGWSIQIVSHKCSRNNEQFIAAACKNSHGQWQIFMHSDLSKKHSCGWRLLSTIRPTDWEDAKIDAWYQHVDSILGILFGEVVVEIRARSCSLSSSSSSCILNFPRIECTGATKAVEETLQ